MLPIKRRINWDHTPYQDPFYDPVPVPDPDPTDAPTRCFQVNHEYVPYLIGALNRLTREDAWRGDAAAQQAGVNKAHTLIATLLTPNCPEGIPDGLCTDFLPENPFISYFPQNPFTQPDYVPAGYTFPPFYTNVTNIVLGIIPQDVTTDLLHFPINLTLPELIGFSFPTIHIELSGTGQCELEFHKILQGGFVTVTVDGNPFQAKVINLNNISLTDISSILAALGILFSGGLSDVHVHEIEFTTPGDHTIDIKFYPHFGGDVIVGFGGGLRRVSFCDTSLQGDMNYMPISNIRVNQATCKWEAEYNGDEIWVEIGDYWIPACVPEIATNMTIVQDPGNGQLQQSFDGGLNYDPIPNAHFLHINADNDPLTNTLDITPATNTVPALRLNFATQPTVNPFQYIVATVGRVFITPQGGFFSVSGSNWAQLIGLSGSPRVQLNRGTTTLGIEYISNPPDPAFDFTYAGVSKHQMFQDRAKFWQNVYLRGDSSSQPRDMALLAAVWETSTDASRKAQVVLSAYDSAAQREVLRGGANGAAPTIAVLGQTPSPRIDMGAVDAAGNEAAFLTLLALEQFGWIAGTFTEGTPPDPGAGQNTGVPVPTLPGLDTLAENVLCSIAEYLAQIMGEWLAWHITVDLFAGELRIFVDKINTDGFLDNDLNFFESNFQIAHMMDIDAEKEWYLTHDAVASTHTPGDAIGFAGEDIFKNAIYAALRVSDVFDQNCFSFIQQNIGFIDDELAFPMADAIGTIPLWFWQRWAFIGMQGTATGCEDLPPSEWEHTEQWVVDSWSSVDVLAGSWTFNVGYHSNGYGSDCILEMEESFLTAGVTFSVSDRSGTTPPFPTVTILDIATGEETNIPVTEWGQNDPFVWEAQIFPQGSQGLRFIIECPPDTTGTWRLLNASGYGPEPVN